MTDWMNDGFAVQVTAPDEQVYPPRVLLGICAVFVSAAIVQLIPSLDHRVGYVTALVAASLGGVVAVIDQKSRANSNYINFGWFSPALRMLRYLSLGAAAGNIAFLAVDAWHGKAIF